MLDDPAGFCQRITLPVDVDFNTELDSTINVDSVSELPNFADDLHSAYDSSSSWSLWTKHTLKGRCLSE